MQHSRSTLHLNKCAAYLSENGFKLEPVAGAGEIATKIPVKRFTKKPVPKVKKEEIKSKLQICRFCGEKKNKKMLQQIDLLLDVKSIMINLELDFEINHSISNLICPECTIEINSFLAFKEKCKEAERNMKEDYGRKKYRYKQESDIVPHPLEIEMVEIKVEQNCQTEFDDDNLSDEPDDTNPVDELNNSSASNLLAVKDIVKCENVEDETDDGISDKEGSTEWFDCKQNDGVDGDLALIDPSESNTKFLKVYDCKFCSKVSSEIYMKSQILILISCRLLLAELRKEAMSVQLQRRSAYIVLWCLQTLENTIII